MTAPGPPPGSARLHFSQRATRPHGQARRTLWQGCWGCENTGSTGGPGRALQRRGHLRRASWTHRFPVSTTRVTRSPREPCEGREPIDYSQQEAPEPCSEPGTQQHCRKAWKGRDGEKGISGPSLHDRVTEGRATLCLRTVLHRQVHIVSPPVSLTRTRRGDGDTARVKKPGTRR